MEHNYVITGVGGQGVILAANVLGEAATAAGYETRVGELHGMSQRGGSVIAHVRYGDRIYGPMVPQGKAEALLVLEPMEALRHGHYLAPDGTILTSFEQKDPFPVKTGDATYPEEVDLEDALQARGHLERVDAVDLARKAGHPMTANVVLVGALSRLVDLDLSPAALRSAVESQVPADAVDANLAAFDLGREAVEAPSRSVTH
jgi:indolepyruvate ferredoxin oxidoreductase beta subunit